MAERGSVAEGTFCIGDQNRQYSQSKRGGTFSCASIQSMYNSLYNLQTVTDTCSSSKFQNKIKFN